MTENNDQAHVGKTKNIFVVGLDPFNGRKLESVAKKRPYQFHSLLDVKQVKKQGTISSEDLVVQAEQTLKSFPGRIDAIVGYWDFPVTCLAPFLSHRQGLTASSLESVLKCEHKYWCRLEQSKVIEETPKFCAVNPFDDQELSKIPFDYPFWIKPVKAFASQLGFRIHNAPEFQDSIQVIRQGISRFAEPFNYFLKQVSLPDEIALVGGEWCIAEEIISGCQCTLEGYVYQGELTVYGVVDSIRESNRSTFSRYQYPSHLPKHIQKRMIDIAGTVMAQIGYDNAPFNMEFFYDKVNEKLWLLEINPRISQSHCDLFEKVDGASHHEVMVDLALGEKPCFPYHKGAFKYAAKFFLRYQGDAIVKNCPSLDELKKVRELFPGTFFNIHVKEGMRLSDLLYQESYSYELGYVCMGANSEHELLENYHQALKHLSFELVPELSS